MEHVQISLDTSLIFDIFNLGATEGLPRPFQGPHPSQRQESMIAAALPSTQTADADGHKAKRNHIK